MSTEASIDLSDDDELMTMMVQAGFEAVFVGIETPSEESLAECSKLQNRGRDLVACVKKIQSFWAGGQWWIHSWVSTMMRLRSLTSRSN